MNKHITILAAILITLTGCSRSNTSGMEDVAVNFSGIAFVKSINGADQNYRIDGNQLSVNGVNGTNYFNAPDGSRRNATAPILLTAVDNKNPFTFTTSLQSNIGHKYDAGAVYLYVDNDNWLKFAFELDEKGRRRVVTVRTNDYSDDNNHDIILQDRVHFRISSNTSQIGFYYSTDGIEWNLARLFRNNYPEQLWIGISSQSPGGEGNIAYFGDMSMVNTAVKNFRLGGME